jgi:inositol oxygenase
MSATKEQIAVPERPTDKVLTIKTNADKADEEFRVYDQETTPKRVIDHYRDMRLHHTAAFYQKMELKYDFANGAFRKLMTIEEAFDELEEYVDASDPDMDLPNKLHLLQTAEGIRRAGHPGTSTVIRVFLIER